MDGNETRIHNEKVLKELRPGDLIRFYQDYGEHWAVYAGEDDKGDKTVIHWWKENAAASSPRITITSFWICADKMIAEKGNSDCIHITEVVKRAKEFMQKLEKEVGEHKEYPDLFYSCEHFAKWCYYGLGGLDKKWCLSEADSVIDIAQVKNVWEFVHGIFTNHTSDGQAIRNNVEVLGQLQPGDVLRFSRGLYEHWATYIGQDKDKTIPKSVIHWWDNDGASDPYIRIVPFWELAGNCTAEKFNSYHPDNIALTESKAVERAKACIEETEAGRKDITTYQEFHCSEDFAKYFYLNLMCKTETRRTIFKVGPSFWNIQFCKHEVGDAVPYPIPIVIRRFQYSVPFTLEVEEDNRLLERAWFEAKTYQTGTLVEGMNRGMDLATRFDPAWSEAKTYQAGPLFECFIRGMDLVTRFDPCSIFTRRKNDEVREKLKPGDLIKFVEKSCNHWGVYIDSDTFIHWTAECDVTEPCRPSGVCMPCIKNESVETLEKAEKLERVNSEERSFHGDQVVKRVQAFEAKIKEGEKKGEDYKDLFNDCEHFATWCHYGLGNKRLKISTEDIEQIKDVRKFVQGEFSPIPWQMYPNKGIPAYQMQQLRISKADIGKESSMGKAGSVSLPKP